MLLVRPWHTISQSKGTETPSLSPNTNPSMPGPMPSPGPRVWTQVLSAGLGPQAGQLCHGQQVLTASWLGLWRRSA